MTEDDSNAARFLAGRVDHKHLRSRYGLPVDSNGELKELRTDRLWKVYFNELNGGPIPVDTYERGDDIPFGAGVYLMIHDGRVKYVGQSVDVERRIFTHPHRWWQRLAVISAPPWWPSQCIRAWLDAMEKSATDRFDPEANNAIVRCRFYLPDELGRLFDRLPTDWV